MTRKSAHEAQSLCPMRRLHVCRLLRPGKRERLGDVGRTMLLHEPDEMEQSLAGLFQLKSEITPHAEIVLEGLAQRIHRAPPGHGKASVRNALISTLV